MRSSKNRHLFSNQHGFTPLGPQNSRSRISKIHKSITGFTIMELLIATMVFAIVLLICSIGLLQIGRVYYKGITAIKTQEAARNIIDQISRDIQFSGGPVAPTPSTITAGTPYVFCVNDQRYSMVTDRQLTDSAPSGNQSYHVLVVDTLAGCKSGSPAQNLSTQTVSGRELVPNGMRLAKLQVTSLGGNLYQVTVRVVAGEDDLLDRSNQLNTKCQGFRAGTQFCAVSELTTVVQKRL